METNYTYIMQHILLAFQHIPTVLYWIENLRLWRPFEYSIFTNCDVQETSLR